MILEDVTFLFNPLLVELGKERANQAISLSHNKEPYLHSSKCLFQWVFGSNKINQKGKFLSGSWFQPNSMSKA